MTEYKKGVQGGIDAFIIGQVKDGSDILHIEDWTRMVSLCGVRTNGLRWTFEARPTAHLHTYCKTCVKAFKSRLKEILTA